jgi:twitching motility protein PilT
MPHRRKLGELFKETGKITEEQLANALSHQRQTRDALGQTLVQMGYIKEPDLMKALVEQTGLEHVDLTEITVSTDLQKKVPFEMVRTHHILPISMEGSTLKVGALNPSNAAALGDLEFHLGHATQPVLISPSHFSAAMDLFFARGYGVVDLHLSPNAIDDPAPVEKNLNSLLVALVGSQGQDLHLSAGAVPALRVDNQMTRLPLASLGADEVGDLVFPILSPTQKRAFEETQELDFSHTVSGLGRFRCNLYQQRGTAAFTARHIVEVVPDADVLGIPAFAQEACLAHQGLILVTGPNGHGKSTTMANFIDHINRNRQANVITIEDPIEYHHKHRRSNINQREVGHDTASFHEALRRVFRQNPDVIVIGELRDYESISTALTAAETGHLVMGTMHTLDAIETVDRILDVFPGHQQRQVRGQLAEALLMVFSQRLIPRKSGQGRVLAWERMGKSLSVKNAIREGKTNLLRSMMQANHDELIPLERSLARLVKKDAVSAAEAAKWSQDPKYLLDLVNQ